MPEWVPPFTGKFTVAVGGEKIGSFTDVSGLSVTIDVEEVVEGGENSYVHKLPRGMRWPNVTLRRGITENQVLLPWLARCSGDQLTGQGPVERPDVTITLLSAAGEPVRSWTLARALPVKWNGPKLTVTSRELAVEELEIAHHGLATT